MTDMQKYQGRYRIPSARWAAWDYSSNAAYFVTICIDDRTHGFGEVINGQMQLTPLGQAAADCWQAIPDHFPFVVLDASVVMPNHVHGILIIDKPDGGGGQGPNRFGPQSQNLGSIVRGYKIGVTKYARKHNVPFKWQARYHDRVIRDEGEYERIRTYIFENPKRWDEDCYYT
jgi:REP element-mobilizing transposase RayT